MHKKIIITLLLGLFCIANTGNVFAESKIGNKTSSQKIFHYLNAHYPDEMKEIKLLLKSDPVAARKKLKVLSDKGLAKLKKDKSELLALVKEYRKNKSQAVLNKIKTKMLDNYEQRVKYETRSLKNIEAALETAKKSLAKLKANKNASVNSAIEKLKKTNN
jgi:hypothetical protein